jgi:3'(2'), 5'-bisphosphate nucleotidase
VPDTTLKDLGEAAREAGKILLRYYRRADLKIQLKADASQVTEADVASSQFLASALPKIWQAPVLCEEAVVPYETRRTWSEYWVVDPLDGTKEFIESHDEYSICIALVRAGKPSLGVIFAPALDELFEAEAGKGAFVTRAGRRTRLISKGAGKPWIAARSRFHDGPETTAYLERNGVETMIPIGSAIKFGRIAEGSANLFLRLKGCHEWDVAAGDILVREAGGAMLSLEGKPLSYNTPTAKVEPFVVLGNAADFARLKLGAGN